MHAIRAAQPSARAAARAHTMTAKLLRSTCQTSWSTPGRVVFHPHLQHCKSQARAAAHCPAAHATAQESGDQYSVVLFAWFGARDKDVQKCDLYHALLFGYKQ
jgi:hypothetical protein